MEVDTSKRRLPREDSSNGAPSPTRRRISESVTGSSHDGTSFDSPALMATAAMHEGSAGEVRTHVDEGAPVRWDTQEEEVSGVVGSSESARKAESVSGAGGGRGAGADENTRLASLVGALLRDADGDRQPGASIDRHAQAPVKLSPTSTHRKQSLRTRARKGKKERRLMRAEQTARRRANSAQSTSSTCAGASQAAAAPRKAAGEQSQSRKLGESGPPVTELVKAANVAYDPAVAATISPDRPFGPGVGVSEATGRPGTTARSRRVPPKLVRCLRLLLKSEAARKPGDRVAEYLEDGRPGFMMVVEDEAKLVHRLRAVRDPNGKRLVNFTQLSSFYKNVQNYYFRRAVVERSPVVTFVHAPPEGTPLFFEGSDAQDIAMARQDEVKRSKPGTAGKHGARSRPPRRRDSSEGRGAPAKRSSKQATRREKKKKTGVGKVSSAVATKRSRKSSRGVEPAVPAPAVVVRPGEPSPPSSFGRGRGATSADGNGRGMSIHSSGTSSLAIRTPMFDRSSSGPAVSGLPHASAAMSPVAADGYAALGKSGGMPLRDSSGNLRYAVEPPLGQGGQTPATPAMPGESAVSEAVDGLRFEESFGTWGAGSGIGGDGPAAYLGSIPVLMQPGGSGAPTVEGNGPSASAVTAQDGVGLMGGGSFASTGARSSHQMPPTGSESAMDGSSAHSGVEADDTALPRGMLHLERPGGQHGEPDAPTVGDEPDEGVAMEALLLMADDDVARSFEASAVDDRVGSALEHELDVAGGAGVDN